jgi:hypothetical protein
MFVRVCDDWFVLSGCVFCEVLRLLAKLRIWMGDAYRIQILFTETFVELQ